MHSLRNDVSQITVQLFPADQIKPDLSNPRRHSKSQLKQLRASIRQFGFTQPVLVDDDFVVIAGNARLAAAKDLGVGEIPVIQLGHLTATERRAYVIADNKIALNAEWDDDALVKELQVLAALELDFDLEITGFETSELDLILLDEVPDEEGDADHMFDGLDTLIPCTQLGDLWICGEHRVLCGNALVAQDYATLMQGDHADLVFTDPPYNVPVNGHIRLKDAGHEEFPMAFGEMTSSAFAEFLEQAFAKMTEVSRQGAVHFICMDWRHIAEIMSAGDKTYDRLLNLCVWNKTNGGMGSFYRSKHELVFVWRHGTVSHLNTVQLGKHGRYRTNVWDYAGTNSFGESRDADLADHPTVKPTDMVVDAILDCSKRGHIILDPFLGSGTTLLAAEHSGRRARVMELDSRYVDVALRRWVAVTGQSPVHAVTQKEWADPLQHCAPPDPSEIISAPVLSSNSSNKDMQYANPV